MNKIVEAGKARFGLFVYNYGKTPEYTVDLSSETTGEYFDNLKSAMAFSNDLVEIQAVSDNIIYVDVWGVDEEGNKQDDEGEVLDPVWTNWNKDVQQMVEDEEFEMEQATQYEEEIYSAEREKGEFHTYKHQPVVQIKEARKEGLTDDQIEDMMIQQGVPAEEIEEWFEMADQPISILNKDNRQTKIESKNMAVVEAKEWLDSLEDVNWGEEEADSLYDTIMVAKDHIVRLIKVINAR